VFPQLAEIARREAIPAMARLSKAARAARIPVIHCVAHHRADGLGMNDNARLFGAARRSGVALLPGSNEAAVIGEIGVEETDVVVARIHGLGPMHETGLDAILRNLGARAIVVAGVSVNVGITNLVMDAVNRGFHVILPRDAIAGVPEEYASAVIENTLSLLATVTTADEIAATWSG